MNMCGGNDCVVGAIERELPDKPQCGLNEERCSYPCTRQTTAVRNLTAQGLLEYLIGQLHLDNFITKVYQERFQLNGSQINIPDQVGLWQNGAWSSFVDYYYVRIEIERECSIMREDPTLMALLCNFQSLDIDCRGENYYQDQYQLMSTSRSFINVITLDLVYISHQNYCEIGVVFSEWRLVSVVLVILLIIISSISLILFIIFSVFAIAYLSTNLRLLPEEIRWSFLEYDFFLFFYFAFVVCLF
jgi:hypothetical protein